MNREKFWYLIEACGTDKNRMAELALLLAEASVGYACMQSMCEGVQTLSAEEQTKANEHAVAILAAVDELQRRVKP